MTDTSRQSLRVMQEKFISDITQTGQEHLKSFEAGTAERMKIYQNNFFAGLEEVLQDVYPSIEKLVGAELFQQLSQSYWQNHPPSSPVMLDAGQSFPRFLQQHESLIELAYLSDIARIDYYYNRAYYLGWQTAISPEQLTQIPASELACANLTLQKSSVTLSSHFAIYDIWQLNHSDEPTQTVNAAAPQTVHIFANQYGRQLVEIDTSLQQFLDALTNQHTLEDSLNHAIEQDEEFEASAAISYLLQNELITEVVSHEKAI